MRKVVLAALVTASIVTTGAVALVPDQVKDHTPIESTANNLTLTAAKQSVSPATSQTSPSPTSQQPAPVKPVTTTSTASATPNITQPVTSTPDQNKSSLQTLILNTAASYGLTGTLLNAQWMCVDKIISYNLGWSDYNAALNSPVSQVILKPWTSGSGAPGYHYYDGGGTCRIMSNPAF